MSRSGIIAVLLPLIIPLKMYALDQQSYSEKKQHTSRIFQTGVEKTATFKITSKRIYENSDISAVAAVDSNHGVLGADEGNYAQLCLISRTDKTITITDPVKSLVKLLPRPADSEVDIEGIAVIDATCYVTGSHGLAKRSGEFQRSRHNCFRFKIDPETGNKVGNVQTSTLRDVLQKNPVLSPYYNKILQQRGVNIESLAAKNKMLYFGLRSPNLNGNAFVIEISPKELFESRIDKKYRLHIVRVGNGLGIREMASVENGFLIITGNAGSEPGNSRTPDTETDVKDWDPSMPYYIFFWDGAEKAEKIGKIPRQDKNHKAEAMLVLEETPFKIEVLVLFDGPEGGSPTIYEIKKSIHKFHKNDYSYFPP